MLGFEVKHNRKERWIALNQQGYIEAMAKKFGQENMKPAYTLMEPGVVLSKDQCPNEPIDIPYQQACGHLLWPAIVDHPDIQFAVGVLAQYTKNPIQVHWLSVKHII